MGRKQLAAKASRSLCPVADGAKLANEQFRTRAPAAVVAREEERLATASSRLRGLEESLAEIS